MRTPTALVLLLAGLVILAPRVVLADTVYLKSGGVIEGKIVAETEVDITVQVGSVGQMTFKKKDIEKIEKDDRTGKIHEKPGTIKGRKKPPEEKEEEEPEEKPGEKPAAKKPPAKPLKDCPWVDTQEVTPEEMEQAMSQIHRLSGKTKFRNRARNHLRGLGTKSGMALVSGLGNQNANVRKECAMLIAELGYKPGVPALIAKGLRDDSIPVQEQAVIAVRKLTGKKFGFPPGGYLKDRQAAQEKWDKWWAGEVEKYGLEP